MSHSFHPTVRRTLKIILLVLSLTFCYVTLAQPASQRFALINDSVQPNSGFESLFSSLRWRNIGPNRGGRSIASTGVVKRPLEYYFGAVGGGLWKTSDGGTNWNPVTDNQIHSSSVGAVAFRNRTRTSFTSAWENRAFAATSCRATVFTNQTMPARRDAYRARGDASDLPH
jgi:hypothetical protein